MTNDEVKDYATSRIDALYQYGPEPTTALLALSIGESSSSSEVALGGELPRIYVSSYEDDGFVVTYENIPASIGFIEFNYAAV